LYLEKSDVSNFSRLMIPVPTMGAKHMMKDTVRNFTFDALLSNSYVQEARSARQGRAHDSLSASEYRTIDWCTSSGIAVWESLSCSECFLHRKVMLMVLSGCLACIAPWLSTSRIIDIPPLMSPESEIDHQTERMREERYYQVRTHAQLHALILQNPEFQLTYK